METRTGTTGVPSTIAQSCRAKLAEAAGELDKLDARLAEIAEEEQELSRKKERLQIVIETLEPLCAQEQEAAWSEVAGLSIQECCYRLLQEEGQPLSAMGIRVILEDQRGVDMKRYANPLAVIHTSLKRIPDRVRSFRKKERAWDSSAKVWVRYYEAVKPGANPPPKK